jgi:hypothetical protein
VAAEAADQAATDDRRTLGRYAADTWRSFELLLDPGTGLPSDNVSAAGERSRYTSPTNVGAYLWSTLAARDAGIISPAEARKRIAATLASVARLDGRRPADGGQRRARAAGPGPRPAGPMDFGSYYDPAAGLLRGGFWVDPPGGQCTIPGNYRDPAGPPVLYTCHHYGSLNTEPRIASYLGIALGQVPASHYFRMARTFPPTCDWGWQEQQPAGVTRTYLGVEVFEATTATGACSSCPAGAGACSRP